jgi:hypothetical protein
MPFMVSGLFPPAQLECILHHLGAYAVDLERLYDIIPQIPKIGSTDKTQEPPYYLHYYTGTAEYFISEYDGEDTMYGKVRSNVYPAETVYQKFSLANLKTNQYMKLAVPDTAFS